MKFILHVLLISLCFNISCSTNQTNLTGTSEQGNARIIASIYTSEGAAAVGATVRLRPSDYIASQTKAIPEPQNGIIDGVVGPDGMIMLESFTFKKNRYTLEINDNTKEALLKTILVESDTQTVELGKDSLEPYSSLKGRIILSQNSHAFSLSLKIPGLERSVSIDSTGHFLISDLPAATYSLKIEDSDTSVVPLTIENVITTSGITTIIPDRGWYHSRPIYINTAQYVNKVTQPLYNFSLPVRLDSTNFDFSQSDAKGKDIWFMKPDRTLIPFQIEQWDSTSSLGIIWVKIDTVYNNDTSQYFVMHWGDPYSDIKQTPGNVFETGDGYAGVWHCNESTTEEAVDNTFNRFHGTRINVTAVDGVLGNGQLFNGSTSCIKIKNTKASGLNLNENSEYALGAWVNPSTLVGEQVIIGKGPTQYALKIIDNTWVFTEHVTTPASGVRSLDAQATADAWTHLFVVSRNENLYLYVNGTIADSTINFISNGTVRNESIDVNIGGVSPVTDKSTHYFNGILDEISISVFPRSDEWIWLSYESQRAGSTLLVHEQ